MRPLRIALYDDPLTLDPHQRNQLLTFTVLRNIYEALTAFDAGAKVGPSLAESWENPSDLCWIFRLRRGVRFHDGHELTAEDVLYSFERARHMPKSNVGGYLVSIDRVRAVDRYTVEVTTTQPFPVLLNKLAFILIVPAGSPEEIDHPVGTGPYRLESYTPKKRLSLAAFADYWGGMPPERRVEFVPEPDLERRIQALIAGEVDIIQEPGAANIERIRGAPGTKIVVQDSLAAVFLLLRPDRPPFDDPRVRRAVDLALDRRALVRNVLHGEGTPLGQMVGRNVFGYAPDLEPTLPDLDQARALLAASGHAGGLDVEAPYRSGRGPELEAVREQLARVGIRLHPSERPWVELFPQLLSGDQDLYFGAWFCLSADASDLFDAMVHTRDAVRGYGASNFNRFSNPQLDEGIEQTSRTLDLLNRRHGLESCMRLLMADHSFLPLYSPSVLFGVRENVDWQLRRDGLVLAKGISRHPEIG
ncbi:MAG: ABC transporter substrate-binding protein [Acidobacteriota bacterium]